MTAGKEESGKDRVGTCNRVKAQRHIQCNHRLCRFVSGDLELPLSTSALPATVTTRFAQISKIFSRVHTEEGGKNLRHLGKHLP